MIFRTLLFYFCLLLALGAHADGPRIAFEGVTDEDQKWLLEDMGPGTELSPQKADWAIRKLMSRGNYVGVKVFKSKGSRWLVRADLQKKIRSIVFKGRDSVGEIEALNAIAIKPESRLDNVKLQEAAGRLQELYGRSGYFNPVIKVSVPNSEAPEVDVLIDIEENTACRLKNIEVITDNPKLKKSMESLTKSFRNDVFSESKIQELESEMNEYLGENRFLSAQLLQERAKYNNEKTEAHIVYRINKPFRFYVRTKGNVRYTRADLLGAAGLDDFDRTSLNPAAEIAERMRRKYISTGFANAKINFEMLTNKDPFVKVVSIQVDEGPRVQIDDILVAGRLSRGPKYYAEFIENNSSEAIDDGFYVKDDLDLGLKNLLTELNNQGFLRAKIQAARPDFNKDKSRVSLTVVLDEGPLTQVKKIRFSGNASYPDPILLEKLGLLPNKPLRLNQLEKGLQDLKNFYRNQGHIEMGIENERGEVVKYDDKGYEARIHIKIYEGPKVYVREILVEGNSFTRDYVIQREINIDPGELLTPEKLDEAQKRLDKLNIFSRVEIRTLEANTKVSMRTLVVKVTERNPGSFRIGFGVTNRRRFTVRGFSGVSYSNLGGKARAIGVRATAENNLGRARYLEYEFGIGYLEPFLFDSRFRGRVNVSREERVTDYTEATDTSTVEATNRLRTLVERDITSKIKFSWNFYSLEGLQRFQEPPDPSEFMTTETTVATIGPILDIDYRDNPFLPSSGFFTRLEADYSAPELESSEQVQFVRTQATFSYYQPLGSKRFVWANSIRGGYAKNISNVEGSAIPRSYSFFLGGFTTIRGYSGTDNDRTPSDTELGEAFGIQTDDILIIPNETRFHLFKSELRFPVYGILGGVLFYDAGEVWLQGANRDRPLKRAYGIGLRINTPVGPISLDYGRKVDPTETESPDHFHLSIGTF